MAAASLRVRHHGLGMVGYVLSRAGAEWLLKAALRLGPSAPGFSTNLEHYMP